MPLEDDGFDTSKQMYFNVAGWATFPSAITAVFQIATTDMWSSHLFNMINATEIFIPILFVFFIHMLGTYYIMQLTMVVIMENYIEAEEVYSQEEIELQQRQIKSAEENISPRYFKNIQQINSILATCKSDLLTLNYCEEDGLVYRKKQ